MVETALGRYSSGLISEWSLPDGFVADEVSARMPDAPKVWSDGSLVLDSVTGVSAAGAGMFARQSELCWSDRRWGHVDRVQSDGVAHSCRVLCLSLDLCKTVQRAELWELFLLFSLPMPFMWGLTILVLFGMLGACWMIAIVLLLLSLLLMVTFLFLFARCLIFVVGSYC